MWLRVVASAAGERRTGAGAGAALNARSEKSRTRAAMTYRACCRHACARRPAHMRPFVDPACICLESTDLKRSIEWVLEYRDENVHAIITCSGRLASRKLCFPSNFDLSRSFSTLCGGGDSWGLVSTIACLLERVGDVRTSAHVHCTMGWQACHLEHVPLAVCFTVPCLSQSHDSVRLGPPGDRSWNQG
jgi:hypothetical protein